MISELVLESIRNGTCAIGYCLTSQDKLIEGSREKRQVYEIIGTGFLIRDNIVITNRHVVQGINKIEKKYKNLEKHQKFLVFTYPIEKGKLTQGFCYIKEMGTVIITNNEYDDIAFIEFKQRPELEEKCQPLLLRDENDPIKVGSSIGVCGYAGGNDLLVDSSDNFYRFGPILQQGFVSALADFDNNFPKKITQILTDVRTMGGMSGSPVFDTDTGKVIGIHWGSNNRTTGFAVPLSIQKVDDFLLKYNEEKK